MAKEKKAKKDDSGKTRKIKFLDKQLSDIVSVKLYQLDAAVAHPFVENGKFSFRVGFNSERNGVFTIHPKNRCPVISVETDDILQTENETAQRFIEGFSVPQSTERNGNKHASGKFFSDVTKRENSYSIDLDEIFNSAVTE